jgi:phosphatidylserine/phosphatidylglycerophosphate/cardiolipin synthase-like enzyme
MIVDGERAFVGSANLTEAAHERNIEVGTMVSNQKHALSLRKYFMELIEIGKLCKLN